MGNIKNLTTEISKVASTAAKEIKSTTNPISSATKAAVKESGVIPGGYYNSSLLRSLKAKEAAKAAAATPVSKEISKIGDKFTIQQTLDISNRLKMDRKIPKNYRMVWVDTKKFDELWKQNPNFYVAENGVGGTANKNRYERFIQHLETKEAISPADGVISKDASGNIQLRFNNGRHRSAVLRDKGMESIPFAMDDKSIVIAREAGLLSDFKL